jgi:hypothetical protein
MKDFIEAQLRSDWPIQFLFESLEDARACHNRLRHAGVAWIPGMTDRLARPIAPP